VYQQRCGRFRRLAIATMRVGFASPLVLLSFFSVLVMPSSRIPRQAAGCVRPRAGPSASRACSVSRCPLPAHPPQRICCAYPAMGPATAESEPFWAPSERQRAVVPPPFLRRWPCAKVVSPVLAVPHFRSPSRHVGLRACGGGKVTRSLVAGAGSLSTLLFVSCGHGGLDKLPRF